MAKTVRPNHLPAAFTKSMQFHGQDKFQNLDLLGIFAFVWSRIMHESGIC